MLGFQVWVLERGKVLGYQDVIFLAISGVK